MKRILSGFVILVMVLNIACISVFADVEKVESKPAVTKEAEISKEKVLSKEGLENALKLVKSKINVPSNYTQFTSELSGYDGKTAYRLRWTSDSMGYAKDGGTLDVTVDQQGTIITYNHYRYIRDYEYKRRLPRITKAKAMEIARKYVYFWAADIADQISFDENNVTCSIEFDGNYRINLFRQHKSIPFYENGISMLVNGISSEIIDFNRNWNEKLVFPEPEKAFDVEKAKTFYRKNIGIELKYRRTYGLTEDRTYLEYSPASVNTNASVDAFTGDKVIENNKYNLYGEVGSKYELYRRGKDQAMKDINLTEQEMSKMKEFQGLMTSGEAEKLARSMEELGIDNAYSLNRYNYYEFGEKGGEYGLRLEFMKPVTKDDLGGNIPEEKLKVMIAAGEFGRTAVVTFNAKTSQILSFNSYGRFEGNTGKDPYKRADLQKVAEAFLSKNKSEKFKESTLMDTPNGFDTYIAKYSIPYYNGEYSFIYARKVNGISFEDNQMTISFDPGTGKISYYGENWDNIGFVPLDKAIGQDKAYEVLFGGNSLEKRYTISQPTGEVKLVYGFSTNKPVCVDAEKGVLITYYNAEPFKGSGVSYKDIEKHPAKEQIKALAELGILTVSDNFEPDKAITQKDWIYMISKARGNYYMDMGAGASSQQEIDGIYRVMINEGILDESEKDPDAAVTRENAIRYLLNSMGYKKFAELEGIFNCEFTDKNELDPKLLGYATIAKSLKIAVGSNGYLRPKAQLTRSEAALMIYNYMTN